MTATAQGPASAPGRGRSEPSVESPSVTLYGAGWCSDCRRSRALLDALGVPYRYVDVEHDPTGPTRAHEISGGTHIPVITFPDATFQVEPSDVDLRAKLTELELA